MVDKLKVKGEIVEKYPYISGPINLSKAIQHFRSSLPPKIDAPVLKKLGIAPKNESYLINILRFLNLIDKKGTPTPEARRVLTQHDNTAFGDQLSQILKKAYSDLFSLHSDKTWELDTDALITYFRESNQTSSAVGYRQAITFQTLAAFAGHGEVPGARSNAPRKPKMAGTRIKEKKQRRSFTPGPFKNQIKDIGLTVRIEINLPVAEDQATYDRIFKSIKENLLNG